MDLFTAGPYVVRKGTVWLDDRKAMGDGYCVVNLETDVIEAERTNLPESMMLCTRLNDMLTQMRTPPELGVPLPQPPVPASKSQ